MSGQISDTQLLSQLNSGNLTPFQRETVAAVLKILSNHGSGGPLMPPRATLTPSPTPQVNIETVIYANLLLYISLLDDGCRNFPPRGFSKSRRNVSSSYDATNSCLPLKYVN